MKKLREFNELHIGEDCRAIRGTHENGLFAECTFDKLNGLTLKDCDLSRSEFTTSDIRDALGFTMTLGCFSFRRVKYSPLLFDLFLMLAYMSVGNDEKREKLLDVVGRDRAVKLLRILERLE